MERIIPKFPHVLTPGGRRLPLVVAEPPLKNTDLGHCSEPKENILLF